MPTVKWAPKPCGAPHDARRHHPRINRKIVCRLELVDVFALPPRALAGSRISASASAAGSSTRCMPRGRVHWQRQGPETRSVRRQGQRGDANRRRGGGVCCDVKRLRVFLMTGRRSEPFSLTSRALSALASSGSSPTPVRGRQRPKHAALQVDAAGQKRGLTAASNACSAGARPWSPRSVTSKTSTGSANHLAGRAGDAANAVLAAVGYNFGLLLRLGSLSCCARAGRPRSAEQLEPDHRSVVIRATSRATISCIAGVPSISRVAHLMPPKN